MAYFMIKNMILFNILQTNVDSALKTEDKLKKINEISNKTHFSHDCFWTFCYEKTNHFKLEAS